MVTITEYARIADAVYQAWPEAPAGWTCPGGSYAVDDRPWLQGGSRSASGLQARVFLKDQGKDAVIAFKGTVCAQGETVLGKIAGTMYKDLANDAVLAVPFSVPPQATDAMKRTEEWASALRKEGRAVTLAGHSLGGALAQVVGFRLGIKFVTFNAPGMWTNSHGLSISGMVRAWTTPSADVGVNYRGPGISPIAGLGVHIGRAEVLTGAPSGHGIAALAHWLEQNPKSGNRDPFR